MDLAGATRYLFRPPRLQNTQSHLDAGWGAKGSALGTVCNDFPGKDVTAVSGKVIAQVPDSAASVRNELRRANVRLVDHGN